MRTVNTLLCLLMLSTMPGCSALTKAINPISAILPSDEPSIDIKAQVGKTNIINDALVNTNTGDKIEAESIGTIDKSVKHSVKADTRYDNVDKIVTHTTTQNIPPWAIAIMCIGWMFIFITPKQLYQRWRS